MVKHEVYFGTPVYIAISLAHHVGFFSRMILFVQENSRTLLCVMEVPIIRTV